MLDFFVNPGLSRPLSPIVLLACRVQGGRVSQSLFRSARRAVSLKFEIRNISRSTVWDPGSDPFGVGWKAKGIIPNNNLNSKNTS